MAKLQPLNLSSIRAPFSIGHHVILHMIAQLNDRDVRRLLKPKVLVDDPEAILRNRSQFAVPWEHNRIHLSSLPCSYINASPITLDDRDAKGRYIACQSPLESNRMWRMTWEQDVSVIVMLNLPVENGAEKCIVYYPEDESDIIDEGGFKITLVEKTQNGGSEVRKLQLSHGGEQRTIWHFHYKNWPHGSVPTGADLANLLSLMDLSMAKKENSKARIIHCNLGLGRTGTFIMLEHLIRKINRGVFDLKWETATIFRTVDCLRRQRMRMIGGYQLRKICETLRHLWLLRQANRVHKQSISNRSNEAERPRKRRRSCFN